MMKPAMKERRTIMTKRGHRLAHERIKRFNTCVDVVSYNNNNDVSNTLLNRNNNVKVILETIPCMLRWTGHPIR